MKAFLAPAIATALCTAFTTWMCHLAGMTHRDVYIAAIVAFGVSATVAFTTTALAGPGCKSPPTPGAGR